MAKSSSMSGTGGGVISWIESEGGEEIVSSSPMSGIVGGVSCSSISGIDGGMIASVWDCSSTIA